MGIGRYRYLNYYIFDTGYCSLFCLYHIGHLRYPSHFFTSRTLTSLLIRQGTSTSKAFLLQLLLFTYYCSETEAFDCLTALGLTVSLKPIHLLLKPKKRCKCQTIHILSNRLPSIAHHECCSCHDAKALLKHYPIE